MYAVGENGARPCGVECTPTLHRPRDTHEALRCMRRELERLYADQDDRAIFLRAYHAMTSQVHAAVHGNTRDFPETLFFDPAWVDRLAGRFAQLYFESLQRQPACGAWERALAPTGRGRRSPLLHMLLGINAHINFDLAFAVRDVLQGQPELDDPKLMARRKFDHDQTNNILMRTNPKLQEVLVREFGGGTWALSEVFGKTDELLTITGLRYYRDRVWHSALGLLSARDDAERRKVRLRLDWESLQTAEFLEEGSWLNDAVFCLDGLLRRRRFGRFEPEKDGGVVKGEGRREHRLQRVL